MDQTGLVLVTFQGEQHPLPPGWVEPAVEAHVVADENGVDFYAPVRFLQQVFHLQVLQVGLEADVVIRRLGHLGLAEPLTQHVARVARATAGAVVGGAGEAGGRVAHRAGQGRRADHLVVGTRARVRLFGKAAQEAVLIAVEKRLDACEPVGGGSRKKQNKRNLY